MLAFTMFWGYLLFSQFLIIWTGNLAEEIPWYVRRLHGGGSVVGRSLILLHFAVPFLVLLLERPVKRNIKWLWKVAALVAGRPPGRRLLADRPARSAPRPRQASPTPLLAPSLARPGRCPSAMGGIWLSAFLWFLKGQPLMVAHDPELLPALKQASGGH